MHASNKNLPLVDVSQAVTEILAKRKQAPSQRSLLIGVSGIDGCGKGYPTDKIVAQLQLQGQKTVSINDLPFGSAPAGSSATRMYGGRGLRNRRQGGIGRRHVCQRGQYSLDAPAPP